MNLRIRLSRRMAIIIVASCLSGCATGNIPLLSQTGVRHLGNETAARSKTTNKTIRDAAAVVGPVSVPAADQVKVSEFPLSDGRTSGELRFQSGDTVKVTVWGYAELDHTAVIQPNGKITLPLAGEVDAAGASAADLRQRIIDKLEPFTKAGSGEIRSGDTLVIDVWQHNELRSTAIVDPSGMVTFPLVGQIRAVGSPVDSIRKEAEHRLLTYVSDARVTILPTFNNRRVLYERSVSVLAQTLQPRRVAVIGEVSSPGLTEIRGSLRLVEALAQAQMRDKTAELNSIVVIRNYDSGTPQYRMIRVADYFEGRAPDQNIQLQNNDIVVVPKTVIAKVGEFVELFFSRTAPVFSWWTSMFQASVAPDSAETTRLINDALRRSLNAISINPSR